MMPAQVKRTSGMRRLQLALRDSPAPAVHPDSFDAVPARSTQAPRPPEMSLVRSPEVAHATTRAALLARAFAAATEGNMAVLGQAVQAGARPHLRGPNGETLLVTAIAHGHVDLAHVLVALGADPNLRDLHARLTPLSAAARLADARMMETLLAAGAEPDLLGSDGRSALWHAEQAGQANNVAFLRSVAIAVVAAGPDGPPAAALTNADLRTRAIRFGASGGIGIGFIAGATLQTGTLGYLGLVVPLYGIGSLGNAVSAMLGTAYFGSAGAGVAGACNSAFIWLLGVPVFAAGTAGLGVLAAVGGVTVGTVTYYAPSVARAVADAAQQGTRRLRREPRE